MLVEDAQGPAWKVVPSPVVTPPAWCKMEEVTGSVCSLEMCKSNEAVERGFQSVTFLTPLALNQVISLIACGRGNC